MSRISRKRPPAFPCPHCEQPTEIRSSFQQTPLVREVDYICRNHHCGHTFVIMMEAVRTIVPSAMPNPDIRLPFGNPNLGPRRVPKPANDDHRNPANDDAGDVASAVDPMSG